MKHRVARASHIPKVICVVLPTPTYSTVVCDINNYRVLACRVHKTTVLYCGHFNEGNVGEFDEDIIDVLDTMASSLLTNVSRIRLI